MAGGAINGNRPQAPDVRTLAEGHERYQSLVAHSPHAVFSLDLRGVFQDANPVAEQVSGHTREQLRTMNFRDLILAEDQVATMAAFTRALSGEPIQIEARIAHAEGRLVDLHIVAVPVVINGEVISVHGVAEDVTERNQIARELLEARRLAEEANEAKSVWLANISHELRTPLTTMLGTAELLEDSDLDQVQARFVAALQRNGRRLGRLIEDILGFSRLQAGAMELRLEAFDPRAMLAEAAEWPRGQAIDKGLELDVVVDAGVPQRLVGDALRLGQVLTNVLENAVKFTDRGSVVLTAQARPLDEDRVDLHLSVRDTGIGIPEEAREHLFHPFTQADQSVTRLHEGAGLGLAICSELVTLMGGTIDLESEQGRGTAVAIRLTLPVA